MEKSQLQQTLKEALPVQFSNRLPDSTLEKIYQMAEGNEEVIESFKSNFVHYKHILIDGSYTIDEYINAVMYVSYKLMNLTNKEAYEKVFPERIARLKREGKPEKSISAYISSFSKSKLVVTLLEQVYVPVWLLNQKVYQDAINVQADLMMHARSEMVRCKAADSLLARLARPESINPTVNVNVQSNQLSDLENAIYLLVTKQKNSILEGKSVKDVAGEDIKETIDDATK